MDTQSNGRRGRMWIAVGVFLVIQLGIAILARTLATDVAFPWSIALAAAGSLAIAAVLASAGPYSPAANWITGAVFALCIVISGMLAKNPAAWLHGARSDLWLLPWLQLFVGGLAGAPRRGECGALLRRLRRFGRPETT